MNAAEALKGQLKFHAKESAFYFPGSGSLSFAEFEKMLGSAQKYIRSELGLKKGDTVLLLEPLGPAMYASIVSLLACGVTVILVEPWLRVDRINKLLHELRPKAFFCNWMARLWGLRVSGVRKIPSWISTADLFKQQRRNDEFICEDVDPEHSGIITFTSGTTGIPKGVQRSHSYLMEQNRVLSSALEVEKFPGPDLCIFANFALSNLANGRGSIIMPPKWKENDFKEIHSLTGDLAPVSMTCGPGFLLRLMESLPFMSLKSIHVGGALCDVPIFEKAFARWPLAHFTHVYGSTEAEPVATVDARAAVKNSKNKGFFQTLCLGQPVFDIKSKFEPDTLWISGTHVCGEYLLNPKANQENKRRDESGRLWHKMGDRIRCEDNGNWWYCGREKQNYKEFLLEQNIYSIINSSAGFLNGDVFFVQDAEKRGQVIQDAFPQIRRVFDCQIVRDKRHRARIDRQASSKGRSR